MGYRSDVTLVLPTKHDVALRLDTKLTDVVELLDSAAIKVVKEYESEKFMLYRWNDTKWYDEYPDIAHLIEYLGELTTEDDYEYDYALVVFGEDVTDIEMMGSLERFGLGITRSVEEL